MGAEPVQGEEAAGSDDCGEVQYIQVRGLQGRRDWFATAGVYGERADYGGGGWGGDSSRWRGDSNGRFGREYRLASPLSCAGHQRHLRNQATSGPPRRTGFVRDAGGHQTASIGCSRRYSSRLPQLADLDELPAPVRRPNVRGQRMQSARKPRAGLSQFRSSSA